MLGKTTFVTRGASGMAEVGQRVALLAGASGFVGKLALDMLLDAPDFSRVFAVTRRPLGREHPHLANRIVRFEQIESELKNITCHIALCAIGTTIKEAGSERAFRQADVDAVLAFARAAKAAQAQRFVVVSSVGADPAAKNFYLRTKGEMEEAVAGIGFAAVDILQPSLLLGWRGELRPLELAGILVAPLVNPFLLGKRAPLRAISARTVAAAMVGATRSTRRGLQRHTYSAIQALSRSKPPKTVK
jgi:uncharacterized protein YbjT (DUF2867 family)